MELSPWFNGITVKQLLMNKYQGDNNDVKQSVLHMIHAYQAMVRFLPGTRSWPLLTQDTQDTGGRINTRKKKKAVKLKPTWAQYRTSQTYDANGVNYTGTAVLHAQFLDFFSRAAQARSHTKYFVYMYTSIISASIATKLKHPLLIRSYPRVQRHLVRYHNRIIPSTV